MSRRRNNFAIVSHYYKEKLTKMCVSLWKYDGALLFILQTNYNRPCSKGRCGSKNIEIGFSNILTKKNINIINSFITSPLGSRFCVCQTLNASPTLGNNLRQNKCSRLISARSHILSGKHITIYAYTLNRKVL